MSLPLISVPEYTVQLVSRKDPVRYRPYLVKEEKIFLMAKESGDPKDIEAAVHQIINNCTFGVIEAAKLPSFDIELLFLQLRAKSVNSNVTVTYECQNPVEGGTACGARVPVTVNLDAVTLVTPPEHSKIVKLDDKLTLGMRYPTGDMLEGMLQAGVEGIASATGVIAACIETIVEANGTVHETYATPHEELVAFVESLPTSCLPSLYQFFETIPALAYTTEFKCPKCGYTEPLTFHGLLDFFD
tara:strand:- start:3371 stop:4102 length:732 start_codon:yes stop_codon:yes gene_type:complete